MVGALSTIQRHGPPFQRLDLLSDRLIDLAAQDPRDDLQRGVVCISPTVDKPRRDIGLFHRAADLGAAAMHDHGPHADGGHENDVQQRVVHPFDIIHQTAAQLDHDRLVPEATDPSQGFNQDVGFLYGFLHGLTARRVGETLQFTGLNSGRQDPAGPRAFGQVGKAQR